MSQVVCEHPVIIIHPRLAEFMSRYHHYFFRGKESRLRYSLLHMDDFDYKPFSVKRNNITREDIESCFVVNDETGETYPIYLEVPCGRCSICKNNKINSFVKRCEYETEGYNCYPWFVTLTYNNQNYPVDGVSVRDAQLFLKRFRRNLERNGKDFKIRYVFVGEYGKTTHRAHYHALIWNIQTFTTSERLECVKLLEKSWQKGFIRSRMVDPRNDKGFYYTSKYLKKDCVVPENCNPTFVLSSRGKGGIGSRFIDKHAPELRKTLNVQFKVKLKWKNKVENLQFSRYLLNRVFPSLCKVLTSPLRTAVRGVVGFSRYLTEKYQLTTDFKLFDDKFSSYIYTGSSVPVPKIYRGRTISYCEQAITQLKDIVQKEMLKLESRGYCLSDGLKLDNLRRTFLSKLFMYQHPVDIPMTAYCSRSRLNYSSIYETL